MSAWSDWKVKAIPGIPIFVVPRLKKRHGAWGAAQKSGVSQKKLLKIGDNSDN